MNSLKKENLRQKYFYKIMMNEVLKEITRNKRSGGCIYLIKSVKPDDSNLLTVS